MLPGRRSLFSSRLRLYPRRHRCLRLQLIAERSKVLKLSKRGLERQGRPSRGTPTPLGYGYLTRHLPRKATHARLSGSASQASPSARNEEETRHHAQMPKCSGLSSREEQTPVPRVPLQTGLRFHSHGYEQPLHQRACGITNSSWLASDRCTNSAATTSVSGGKTAAATASGQTLLLKGPRSRSLTGDENQPLKPKSWRPGAQVALTVSPTKATTAAVGSLSSGNHHLSIDDSGHLRTTRPSLGWRMDSCTLSRQQQFAFPRMAGGRLLRTAGGCSSPPKAGGRSGSPAHAEVGPNSPRPPLQPG
jgi:hypothetical protein